MCEWRFLKNIFLWPNREKNKDFLLFPGYLPYQGRYDNQNVMCCKDRRGLVSTCIKKFLKKMFDNWGFQDSYAVLEPAIRRQFSCVIHIRAGGLWVSNFLRILDQELAVSIASHLNILRDFDCRRGACGPCAVHCCVVPVCAPQSADINLRRRQSSAGRQWSSYFPSSNK